MVVADGEGATKRARITVVGARTAGEARAARRARSRESQLVKTALFGGDPNWGRIACAAGYAGRPARARSASASRSAASRCSRAGCRRRRRWCGGRRRVMRAAAFAITVDLATGGRGTATLTTSDLTPAYVSFNSAYST